MLHILNWVYSIRLYTFRYHSINLKCIFLFSAFIQSDSELRYLVDGGVAASFSEVRTTFWPNFFIFIQDSLIWIPDCSGIRMLEKCSYIDIQDVVWIEGYIFWYWNGLTNHEIRSWSKKQTNLSSIQIIHYRESDYGIRITGKLKSKLKQVALTSTEA